MWLREVWVYHCITFEPQFLPFEKNVSDASFLAYQNWSVNIKIAKIDQ